MTAPNSEHSQTKPDAGAEPDAGHDAPRAPAQGVPTPGQAEGDDDVNPPLPGSPRG